MCDLTASDVKLIFATMHVACRADCRPNFACPDISCHCMQGSRPCLLLW